MKPQSTSYREPLPLDKVIDGIVRQVGLVPTEAQGAKLKLALCELYERTPPGFEEFISFQVFHDQQCPILGKKPEECNCKRTFELGLEGQDQKTTVH